MLEEAVKDNNNNNNNVFFIYIFVCVHSAVHVWKSEDNFGEWLLSFYNVGPRA